LGKAKEKKTNYGARVEKKKQDNGKERKTKDRKGRL
jgi:hypothetical protein